MSPALQPRVAILLCTYHGQRYLAEQLDSFSAQTWSNWVVWASDDGSEDGTHAVLDAYQKAWPPGRLLVHRGPARGFVANFLSLACKSEIAADYYAFSDQDDIWEADRLDRALNWLKKQPVNVPALYCSRTRYISKDGQDLGFSRLFKKPPSFRNALVQSIAGGNTMVFNRAAHGLLANTPSGKEIVSHDWWAYLLVSGCGGRVFYDPYPGVRYRQHGHNMAGQNTSALAKLIRAKGLLAGRFRHWNQLNENALRAVGSLLTPENQRVLDIFAKARGGFLWHRLVKLRQSGVYRQTLVGNLGLVIAALLKKL